MQHLTIKGHELGAHNTYDRYRLDETEVWARNFRVVIPSRRVICHEDARQSDDRTCA